MLRPELKDLSGYDAVKHALDEPMLALWASRLTLCTCFVDFQVGDADGGLPELMDNVTSCRYSGFDLTSTLFRDYL